MRLLLTPRAQKKVCHLPVAVLEERRSRTHGMEPAPRCDWRPVAGLERAWQLLHRRVRTEPPPTDCSLEFHGIAALLSPQAASAICCRRQLGLGTKLG
jgi:hypothetical protein